MLQRQNGFTLIELLIVILIIGILAAVAIPVFNGQRNKAKEVVAKSQIRQAVTAVVSYRAGHNDSIENSPLNSPVTTGSNANDNQKIKDEEATFSNQAADFYDVPSSSADPKKIWYAGYTDRTPMQDDVERGELAMVCNVSRGEYAYCAMMAWDNVRLKNCTALCTVKDGVYYGRAKGSIVEAFVATMNYPFGRASVPSGF